MSAEEGSSLVRWLPSSFRSPGTSFLEVTLAPSCTPADWTSYSWSITVSATITPVTPEQLHTFPLLP